ncbi:MAG: hypothetical protein H7A32_04210 [Deltaproteobacteria bacterium]|nr:hypothetical protein [Deltaproteobacteria bacterium]
MNNSNFNIGFVAITHYQLGEEVLRIIQGITNEAPSMIPVSIDPDQNSEENKQLIKNAIKSFNNKDAIIILSDFYGATPSNLCQEFLKKGKIEMITGCNMPIVLKASTLKKHTSIEETVHFLMDYGKLNIRNHP